MDRNQLLDLKWRINQRIYDKFQEICQQRCKAYAQRVVCAQFDANGRGHEDGVWGSFSDAVLSAPWYQQISRTSGGIIKSCACRRGQDDFFFFFYFGPKTLKYVTWLRCGVFAPPEADRFEADQKIAGLWTVGKFVLTSGMLIGFMKRLEIIKLAADGRL